MFDEVDMSNWQAVCSLAQVPEGDAIGVECAKRRIALYKVREEVFATDNICPHAFALLSTGFLDDYVVECPLHGARFDIRTGRCTTSDYRDIETFAVDIRDGHVYVDPSSPKIA